MSDDLYAGVELGGTKCIALVGRGPGEILVSEQVPTTTPDETLGELAQLLQGWRADHDFAALGIGSFGPLDLDRASPAYGQITSTPKPGWAGAPVLERLRGAARVPAAIDTDVNGAALAEIQWGAGRGTSDFAYITVGTGVGVGLIVNGQATRGFSHCELGHIRVPRLAGDDFAGSCPFHGDCVEGLAAGPSLKARGAERGQGLDTGDPVWESVAWALAQLCHVVVCTAAPRAIAMGGGVIAGNPHLLGRVHALLEQSLNGYLHLPGDGSYVRSPALGANAGPLGAIALAMKARR